MTRSSRAAVLLVVLVAATMPSAGATPAPAPILQKYEGATATWLTHVHGSSYDLLAIQATRYERATGGDASLDVLVQQGQCEEIEPSYFDCTITRERGFDGRSASFNSNASTIRVDLDNVRHSSVLWKFSSSLGMYSPRDSYCTGSAPDTLPRLEAQSKATATGWLLGKRVRDLSSDPFALEYRGWTASSCSVEIPQLLTPRLR